VKIIRVFVTIIHLSIIFLLLLTPLNSIISPQTFPYLNLLSLVFPVLMMLNVLLILFWIILWKKRALFFITISLLASVPTKRWINWTEKSPEKPNLKIVTMNMRYGQYGKHELNNYLQSTNADIVFAQEVRKGFTISGYDMHANDFDIVAISSKTEIIKSEKLATFSNGNAFYADIKLKGTVIRFVNVYLNPFSFDRDMVKPVESLEGNKFILKGIIKKLTPTFKIHAKEIEDIRRAIDESPYPVILAGDFNSVPNSYEYYELGKGLNDAFLAVGRGSGTSFHDYKFPIRIDYIFTSKAIKPISYRVDRSVKLSDHYGVIAEFKID
jgi:endonuclease/exonuclease/phosphatase (EEP) superfamily protein YafD